MKSQAQPMQNLLTYLCSPYTDRDPAVRQARFDAACRVAAELIRQGKAVFSPVAHSHALCQYGLPLDWQFWEQLDRRFLEACDEVVVLTLDGWQKSVGIRAEMAIAHELGKPVSFHVLDEPAAAPVDTSGAAHG